ncbi:MAG: hypothetical protein EBZ77_06825 [Chitinophagia bacterium]|nr:hypothetical protein [Chitinophagia bacterium]
MLCFLQGFKPETMHFRTLYSVKIGLIGHGALNHKVIGSLTAAGHQVASAQLPTTTHPTANDAIAEVAEWSDLIVMASPPHEARELAYWLGDVRSKVIIDLSANLMDTEKSADNATSAIAAITGSPHVVKALSLYGYEQVFAPLFGGGKYQMIVAGDSLKGKMIAGIMMRECGVEHVYDFGGSHTFPLFDEVARCCASMKQRKNELTPGVRH